jgi:hypothetical protein
MVAIGIVLNLAGLGVFCWLLFTLAVYALPSFVGVTAGLYANQTGAGLLGAVIVALVAGVATLAIAQIVFAQVRTPLVRLAVALVFAVPAALAGFFATHGLAALTMPSEAWQNAFGVVGAMVIGTTAWLRLADAPLGGGTSGPDRDADRRHGLTST